MSPPNIVDLGACALIFFVAVNVFKTLCTQCQRRHGGASRRFEDARPLGRCIFGAGLAAVLLALFLAGAVIL